ncbi:MAG: CDP-glycerol glycerophosphotransferase family protein [Clostridia bacterium]|nr:CDP-glycerol glycerophosphotransferase family protein [Clostridia bacterium]
MKSFFYSLFAVFFRIWRILPVKKNRVCFISMHNEGFNDSLGAVRLELEKRGGYDIKFIDKNDLNMKTPLKAIRFFLIRTEQLATAAYVFLNDNFLPMSRLDFAAETTVAQLWHAEGAFKKFGLSIEQPQQLRQSEIEANKRVSYVVCSSENVAGIYAEAFGVEKEKVLPLGSARTDLLYNARNIRQMKEEFISEHPECENKKIVLYAPTFRDDEKQDAEIMRRFELEKLKTALGDEYAFFIRLHPQIHSCTVDESINLTDYPDVTRLMLICDVLITDYSSICMDFALLGKPTVFFAFDLDYYEGARSFYFDYESYVPGEVVKNTDALIECLKKGADTSRIKAFKEFNFDYYDGKCAARIVDRITGKR